MKHITFFLSLLIVFFGTQISFASDSEWNADEDVTNEIQKELRLAETDMEEDEDLFMDDGEEATGEDLAEEPADVAETPAPAQEPIDEIADEEPAPAPVTEPAPAPAPVKKAPPKAQAKAQPKKAPAKKFKKSARVPASFKQGFKTNNSSCQLHAKPEEGSAVLVTTEAGKKLWLESAGEGWYKGFYKKGHGFFPAHCF